MASELNLKFPTTFAICPLNSNLNGLMEDLSHCHTDSGYKSLIDKVLWGYTQDPNNEVRNILIDFFIRMNNRKHLKKYMYERLKAPIYNTNLFNHIVTSIFNEIQENPKSVVFETKQCLWVLSFLGAFIDNLDNKYNHQDFFDTAFPFYLCILENSTSETNLECDLVLYRVLEQLSTILPKVKKITSNCLKMTIMTYEILKNHQNLNFDITLKCGVVFSYFSQNLPEEEKLFLKHLDYPILDFIDNIDRCMILTSKKLLNVFDTETMEIILNLMILNSVSEEKLYIEILGQNLLEYLYLQLVDLGIKKTMYPDHVTPISAKLSSISRFLPKLKNFGSIFDRTLEFVWAHLDHFVDQVVINTKSLLKTIIHEAVSRYETNGEHLEKFLGYVDTQKLEKIHLNAILATCEILDPNLVIKKCPRIQNQLLEITGISTDRDLAGKIYSTMMSHYRDDIVVTKWLQPVITALNNPNVEYHCALQKIVLQAVRNQPTIFPLIFKNLSFKTNECIVILNCIHLARMSENTFFYNEKDFWRNLAPKEKMEVFMVHQDEEVRIHVLQALAECHKSTEEFTQWELSFLARYFETNVAVQSVSTRNKIVCYFKKVLVRFNTTFLSLRKKIMGNEDVLGYYEGFLDNFVKTLILYLSPDSNFARTSTCLELLIFLKEFMDRDKWRGHFSVDDIANIKHILNDNYESNKAMAVSLIYTLAPEAIGLKNEICATRYFSKCLEMTVDIRPSKSLTATYMFQLLFISPHFFGIRSKTPVTNQNRCLVLAGITKKIENMYEENKGDMIEAASTTPFYGLLLSSRYLLQQSKNSDTKLFPKLFTKLANLCLEIQEHIMPVVCYQSPEGYTPEGDLFNDVIDQSSKAQQIMVHSWKTMKEIMLLLAELVDQTVAMETVVKLLSIDGLLRIGDFFMDVFVKSKHRGVFEQAHMAFTIICRSLIRSKHELLNTLPMKWLTEAIALCRGIKNNPELSATRRSAGLPFLILSIVPVLVDSNHLIVSQTIEPLLQKSQNEQVKIHCLNVLRFIFKNSKLSENTRLFIDPATVLALEGYRSKIWGVRNSSTLLLTTLIGRIFGVANKTSVVYKQEENRLNMALFYIRYQKLFCFLLETLKEEHQKRDSLILHPVFLILSRLDPSHDQTINEQVKNHIHCINVCIRNSSYSTRSLAAKASISLISVHFHKNVLDRNFDRILDKNLGDNERHGLLLQIKYVLHYTKISGGDIDGYFTKGEILLGPRFSHLSRALYMEIVLFILIKYPAYKNLVILKNMVCSLAEGHLKNQATTCQTSYTFTRFQLLTYILINKFQHVTQTYEILTSIILTHLCNGDTEIKTKCLQFLIHLHQENSTEHPLIVAGDVEIHPNVKLFVRQLDVKSKTEFLAYVHSYLISYFHRALRTENDSILLLNLLLLRYYPCFFHNCKKTKQETLTWLLDLASSFNEELVAAVISCIETFIITLEVSELKQLDLGGLLRVLMESSSPNAADFRRLTVAEFLVNARNLFKCKLLKDFDKYNVLNMIMVLLEDDEAIIRNKMSEFPTIGVNFVPYKARESLLVGCFSDLGEDIAVGALVSWALRRLPEVSKDTSEVYERGELNTFAENIPITQTASNVLIGVLWSSGTSVLEVTKKLLVCVGKIPSPMMSRDTKRALIKAFQCIVIFLEKGENLANIFYSTILEFLRENIANDYSSVKGLLLNVYSPVLSKDERMQKVSSRTR